MTTSAARIHAFVHNIDEAEERLVNREERKSKAR